MEGVFNFLLIWVLFIIISLISILRKSEKQLLDELKSSKGGKTLIVVFMISILSGFLPSPFQKNSNNHTDVLVKNDWCYPSCGDDVQSSFKFSSDGTFNSSTIMFGGMSRWGKWEEIDDNTFQLTTTRISTNDQLPEPQTVKLTSDKKLKVGGTTYVGED